MGYIYSQKILFRHCDPAGIVFYPRYFEMMNDCVEAFFGEVLGFPFSEIHASGGVPTAEISTRFLAPSRLGDALEISLRVVHVGRTSLGVEFSALCAENIRFQTKSTLVLVNDAGRPRRWPDAIRQKLDDYQEKDNHDT